MPNLEAYSRASVVSPTKVKPIFVSTIQSRRDAVLQEQSTPVTYLAIRPKQDSEEIAA
jgi:hypothetical protein